MKSGFTQTFFFRHCSLCHIHQIMDKFYSRTLFITVLLKGNEHCFFCMCFNRTKAKHKFPPFIANNTCILFKNISILGEIEYHVAVFLCESFYLMFLVVQQVNVASQKSLNLALFWINTCK